MKIKINIKNYRGIRIPFAPVDSTEVLHHIYMYMWWIFPQNLRGPPKNVYVVGPQNRLKCVEIQVNLKEYIKILKGPPPAYYKNQQENFKSSEICCLKGLLSREYDK